ncbi:MAG: nucleotidyltransferase domain-containing protein [Bacteroidales bacterium]|jgi:predicted nucleotidyltransferase|nr:nucleotidyltransferase domain-containing protein [Bacteroidales bacterium]
MNQVIISKLNDVLHAYPIEKAWLFGSYARDEETDKSDVDIIVKFDADARISLLDFVGIKLDLEDNLHKKVDLLTEDGIMNFAKEYINNDKILIYERTGER